MTLLLSLHDFHVVIEPIEALRPEAAVVAEPFGGRGQRRRVEAHGAELGAAAARDETGAFQHLQMLGDGRLAEIERRHELVDRGLALASRARIARRVGSASAAKTRSSCCAARCRESPIGYIPIYLVQGSSRVNPKEVVCSSRRWNVKLARLLAAEGARQQQNRAMERLASSLCWAPPRSAHNRAKDGRADPAAVRGPTTIYGGRGRQR